MSMYIFFCLFVLFVVPVCKSLRFLTGAYYASQHLHCTTGSVFNMMEIKNSLEVLLLQ